MSDTSESMQRLAGYRVLDLTSSIGALCGKLLRDLGMDVLKIEPRGGDPMRGEPPFANGHTQPDDLLQHFSDGRAGDLIMP